MAEFAALMRETRSPESWREAGGRGTVERRTERADGPDAKPRRSLAGAGVLRKASQRKTEAAAKPRSARAIHADASDRQARAMLNRPVAANFHEPCR